jgi:predicted RNA binding protein YcfA (HicA-like mRNA interferase family)
MKLPRDLSGESLANALEKLGYVVDRQTGSHIRLTTQQNGEHHITMPNHSPIKIGNLSAILRITRDDLINQLFY